MEENAGADEVEVDVSSFCDKSRRVQGVLRGREKKKTAALVTL